MNGKNSVLAIDIGSGTQDILVWHHGIAMENSPKMILPSATTILSRKIDQATKHGQHIFLSGNVMGGGPSSAAVRRHLKAGFRVFAMAKPALTFHDNLNKVRAMGIEIVEKKPIFQCFSPINNLNGMTPKCRRSCALFAGLLKKQEHLTVYFGNTEPSGSASFAKSTAL